MDKALKIEHGMERLVSAKDTQDEYNGNIPRRVRFICPFCRQSLYACAMNPWNVNTPHFKHEKNNEIAHECEMYASNATFSNMYHRMPMPIYLRKSSGSDSVFVMELGLKQLDIELISNLESEGAVLEIGRKRYNVTSEWFGHGAIKLPIDAPELVASSLVKLSHCHSNLFITWGRPEDSRTAMVFSADLDTLHGKRVNYCDSITCGSQLLMVVPISGETELKNAVFGAERLGTVKSALGSSHLAVYSTIAPNTSDSDESARSYLERCGYSLTARSEKPVIIWPPSLEASNEFEPVFNSKRLIFASQASATATCLYLHSPHDTDRDIRRVPFIRAKGGVGGFAVVRASSQMRFASSKNSIAAAAVILWARGEITDKILGDSAFLVKCENTESGLPAISAPFPCRIKVFGSKKGSASTFNLRSHEVMEVQIDKGGSFIVEQPLRASSGFLHILRYEEAPDADAISAIQIAGGRLLLLQSRYPVGKRTVLLRQGISNSAWRKDTMIPRIRKGRR